MKTLFSKGRADAFFEALFGDAAEGAYDIAFSFKKNSKEALYFEFQLTPRPGKCLACNLTYGLPGLFARHPIIDVDGLVKNICTYLGTGYSCTGWQLGNTKEKSPSLHIIPLTITLNGAGG